MAYPPITDTLQPIDPPLQPKERLQVYIAATHRMEPPQRHAFAILIYRATSIPPIRYVSPVLPSPTTNNQRGNLGAVLTVAEWLEKSRAQDQEVTIYSPDSFIIMLPNSCARWAAEPKRDNRDLYRKLLPHFKDGILQGVTFQHPSKGSTDMERRDKALALANNRVDDLFPPAP